MFGRVYGLWVLGFGVWGLGEYLGYLGPSKVVCDFMLGYT